jgi:hypothetical protein
MKCFVLALVMVSGVAAQQGGGSRDQGSTEKQRIIDLQERQAAEQRRGIQCASSLTKTCYSNGPILRQARAPRMPTPELWSDGTRIHARDLDPDAVLHVTVDGSRPSATSPVYTAPIVVSRGARVQVMAMREGTTMSKVASLKVSAR